MPPLDEVIATWNAWPFERRLVRRYCAQVLARQGSLDALYDPVVYIRHLANATEKERQVIRRFLRELQTRVPELASLPLPKKPWTRKPRATSLAVEQFLRTVGKSSADPSSRNSIAPYRT
jgi:phytoene dehydrogenase-like protein